MGRVHGGYMSDNNPMMEMFQTQKEMPQELRKRPKGRSSQLSRAWAVSANPNKPQGIFSVVLQMPPNQNHSLKAVAQKVGGRYVARIYHSQEAKAWLAYARDLMNEVTQEREEAGDWILYDGVVRLELDFYHRTDADDWDGVIKKVSDALQGFAYPDDRQVRQAVVNNFLDRENPRVEVRVIPL
jgi:Holliday junction resolvase RusA-like endonuclease